MTCSLHESIHTWSTDAKAWQKHDAYKIFRSGKHETCVKKSWRYLSKGRHGTVYTDEYYAFKVCNVPSDCDLHVFRNCIHEAVLWNTIPRTSCIVSPKCTTLLYNSKHVISGVLYTLPLAKASLRDVLRSERMHISEIRQMTMSVVRGLCAMHSNGIIHGDIKPGNILQFSQTTYKLTDFSISIFHNLTCTTPLGTMLYRAPECFDCEEYGFASDIWSVGMILVDCVFGFNFLQRSFKSVKKQHLAASLQAFVTNTLPELIHVVPQPWARGFTRKERQSIFAFIRATLAYNSKKRPNVSQLLSHSFLLGKPINIRQSQLYMSSEHDVYTTVYRSMHRRCTKYFRHHKIACIDDYVRRIVKEVLNFIFYGRDAKLIHAKLFHVLHAVRFCCVALGYNDSLS